MKELRDIKIDLLMGNKNPIIDLFNQITSGIEIINCHVYDIHGLEFIYHKDGEWIFYQDCKNENFWCNHMKYWSLFETNLKLGYEEIQAITKYLVEEALKREVNTPTYLFQSEIISGGRGTQTRGEHTSQKASTTYKSCGRGAQARDGITPDLRYGKASD